MTTLEQLLTAAPVRKFLLWHNTTPVGSGPRWDLELTYEDGTKHRVIDVDPDTAAGILRRIMQ